MTTSDAAPSRKRRRRRWQALLLWLFLALLATGIVGVFVARALLVPSELAVPSVTTQLVAVEQGDLIESVQINGALEPRDRARVGFASGARVAELIVAEGQLVRAGDVLARLETRDLELKVSSAQAELDQAQQSLAKLMDGPTEAELAQAAAALARARADLAAGRAEVRPIDIELAKARLDAARQRLGDLEQGLPPDSLASADSQLASAQDGLSQSQQSLESTRDSASRAKTDAQQALERGAQELERVQRSYSDAYWDWDFVQRTGSHPRDKVTDPTTGESYNRDLESYEVEEFKRAFDDAAVNLRNAELSVQNLSEAYDQARESEIEQIAAAERGVDAAERSLSEAQRSYDQARTRGVSAALLEARASLAEAQKTYTDLVDNPQRPALRAAQEAAILEAQAAQQKLLDGPDPVELAQARTALERARAALASAEADLSAATLRAPIAGTVVSINLKPGTLTTSSEQITIADLSGFRIRGQVTEQFVAQLQVGQQAMIAVDAVPGESFSGELVRVSELPDEQSSGGQADSGFGGQPTTSLGGLYPIEIIFAASDKRLRVGMATTAAIAVLSIPNALIIPLQAVEEGPDGPLVRRATGASDPSGQPLGEPVPVKLGPSSGDRVQVLEGLAAGDQLLLPQMPLDGGFPGEIVR